MRRTGTSGARASTPHPAKTPAARALDARLMGIMLVRIMKALSRLCPDVSENEIRNTIRDFLDLVEGSSESTKENEQALALLLDRLALATHAPTPSNAGSDAEAATRSMISPLLGIRAAAIPEAEDTGPGALLTPVVLALSTATWCLFAGRVRGKPPASVGLMVIFLVPPIGLPVYCVWSRGAPGILFGLGFISILLAVFLAARLFTDFALMSSR